MSETPFLIVNVQRPGPGQGYITSSQEDVMQARWGHHGGGPLIALAPSSVQEMFDFTIQAFNYAEEWRVPVILLADETVAHMREKLIVPPWEKIKVVNRIKPQGLGIPPQKFLPYEPYEGKVPPMPAWGDGYRVNVVGLVHHPDGNVTKYSPEMHMDCVSRIYQKIEGHADEIAQVEGEHLEGCKNLLVALIMLVLAGCAFFAARYYARTTQGARRVERFLYVLPWLGPVLKNVAMARFAHTMGTTLSGGMTLVDALEVSRGVTGSALVSDALADAAEAVSRGEPLAATLVRGQLFNPMVVDMIAVGERSGSIDTMTVKAAQALDEEVRNNVDTMAGVLEPMMSLLIAGVVLLVVLAVMLPVFEMNQLIR